mgnify:FL=1
MNAEVPQAERIRRADDRGFWCWLAARAADAWDFIDKRDIDKHIMSWAVFGMTFYVVDWVIDFVYAHPDKPGFEIAAIVAALMVPWTPVQAAVIKWYFAARTE